MLIHKAIRSMKDFGEVYLWLLRYYGFDFIIHYPLSKVWLKHLPTLDLIKQTISGVLELCEKYNIKKKTDKELLIEEALLNLKLLNGDVNKAIKETEDYILSYFLTDDVTLEDEEGEEINL